MTKLISQLVNPIHIKIDVEDTVGKYLVRSSGKITLDATFERNVALTLF